MGPDETTPWVKASASNTGGNCVELRRHGGSIEVRDSKDPQGPALRFGRSEIAAWLDGARRGQFSHLTD